jgi:proteasome lid subunit RPN8/RPN11
MPFRLLLPRRLYEEMVAQAVAELPNECCGLLAGRVESVATDDAEGKPVARVLRRYPLINQAASPTEYHSDDRSMLDADRSLRELNLDLLAVYHSHPSSAPVPSRKDREQNYLGPVMHFIISLLQPEPMVRAWWLGETDSSGADWELVETD